MGIFRRDIHSGVMKVIKQRVAEAQKAHDEDKVLLDEQCASEVQLAESRRDEGKRISEAKHINSIIGKII